MMIIHSTIVLRKPFDDHFEFLVTEIPFALYSLPKVYSNQFIT